MVAIVSLYTTAKLVCQDIRAGGRAQARRDHFVGVWDTVNSVGWVCNAVHFPSTKATNNPDFHVVRHAVSISDSILAPSEILLSACFQFQTAIGSGSY